MLTEIQRQLGLEKAEKSQAQSQTNVLADMLDATSDELTRCAR